MIKKVIHPQVESFLQTLESELDKRNLTVPEFARKINVPKVTVYSWLNRENTMSLEKYYRCLEVLDIKDGEIIQ